MKKKEIILCIETTTEVCSVALSKFGECVSEMSVNEPNAHGTVLTVLIDNILLENKLTINDLSALAYSSGPGSYTGLRIGLSVAKGICFGLDLPLIEISTLQHMSFDRLRMTKNGDEKKVQLYFPMLDARRMEVYGALFDSDLKLIIEPFSCIVDKYNWQELLSDKKICFFGNGLQKSKEILTVFSNAIFSNDYIISASSICPLADKKFNKQEFVNLACHIPFYLKEANVTMAKKKIQ